MGLVQIQSLLARLYTDSVLRERFYSDPQRCGRELGLNEEDVQQVMALSKQQVTRFASSLQNKRLAGVRKALPLVSSILGAQFSQLFASYASTYIPQGVKKSRDDAIKFSAFLERCAREKLLDPPWLPDLINYEQARLYTTKQGPFCLLRRFQYPVDRLAAEIGQGNELPEGKTQPVLMLWLRLFPRGSVHFYMLRLPTFHRDEKNNINGG